jgi:hypothetical protein
MVLFGVSAMWLTQTWGSGQRLISVGVMAISASGSATANLIFDIPCSVALPLGGLLVAWPHGHRTHSSGIAPTPQTVEWEGTLQDPIGAELGIVMCSP